MAAHARNWLKRAPGSVERIEASFAGAAYAPHRHDTYAIAITLAGVQCFDYRGAARGALPGQLVILHPDELHDGRAGDSRPFRYRSLYLAPAEVQSVLRGQPLPFVRGGISDDPRLGRPVRALLAELDRPLEPLEYQDGLYDLAMALHLVAGGARAPRIVNRAAAWRARDFLEAGLERPLSLTELERAAGQDRWQLSRDFRTLFGTSPYRYLIMRRLERARAMMLADESPAAAAHACGFADQSHFARAFKRAFGLTPGAWRSATGALHDRSIPRA